MNEQSNHIRHPKLWALLVMLLALQKPFWMLRKWGNDLLPLALTCLALQVVAYVLWFLTLRPWVIRRLDGIENAQEVRLLIYIFCVLFLCEAQELLAYSVRSNEAPARSTLVFLISILFSTWLALFFANDSPQRLLFHIDEDAKLLWGKLMPLTACALVFSIHGRAALGEARAEAIVFFTFCAECVLAMVYNGKKYGKAARSYPDNPVE